MGPSATSPYIALGCLGFLSFGSIVRQNVTSVAEFAVIGAALLVGFGVFVAIAAVAHRTRGGARRAMVLLTAFAFAEVARFLASALPISEIPSLSYLMYSTISAALTGIAFLGVASALVNAARRYREQRARLVAARAELDEQLVRAQDESRRDRARLVNGTKEVLDAAFRDALESGVRSGDAAGAVLRLVDSTIRPLSRRLDDVAGRTLALDSRPSTVRVRPLVVLRGAVGRDAFDPRPAVATIMLLTFGFTLYLTENRGIAIGIAWFGGLLVATGGVLVVAHLVVGQRLHRWPLPVRVIVVSVVYSLMASAVVFVDEAVRQQGSLSGIIYLGAIGLLLPLILSVLRGLSSARAQVLDDLEATNAHIRRLSGRELAVIWSEHRELGRAVHRDVQAAAIAAAWRYRLDTERGDTADTALRALRTTVTDAVESLGLDPDVPTVAQIVTRAHQTWEGICDLEIDIADGLARTLDADPGTRRILAELLAEFVINAVKHGRATRATASVTPIDDSSIEMRFWNNGLPVDLAAAYGLGLNDVVRRSIGFRARNVADGVEFQVVITY